MIGQRQLLFYLLFTLSGFSGLIYESIWTHYLKLFLGHAAYAQTLVLTIFMGGMALGSWLCSRYTMRWGNLFLGYAIVEGVVGLLALVFHELFDLSLHVVFSSILPSLGSPIAISLAKWTLAGLLILPQTILLGMTFPLMSAAMIRCYPKAPGHSLGMLYLPMVLVQPLGFLPADSC
jgi:spermidine synthase